jgi:hypothetical protein
MLIDGPEWEQEEFSEFYRKYNEEKNTNKESQKIKIDEFKDQINKFNDPRKKRAIIQSAYKRFKDNLGEYTLTEIKKMAELQETFGYEREATNLGQYVSRHEKLHRTMINQLISTKEKDPKKYILLKTEDTNAKKNKYII